MKTMYIIYGADKSPLGIFSSKADRDKQPERCGGSSHYNDTDLETAAAAFIDKYGDGADVSRNNSMLANIVRIADNERQNAFALGFETAVSLILSRELI